MDRLDIDLLPRGLSSQLGRLFPDYEIVAAWELRPDTGASRGASQKATGYGRPVRLALRGPHGETRELVWRVATANVFGHDRRSDRAASTLLAYDDFALVPEHVEALDVGAIETSGELVSLRHSNELYLLTTFARGTIYAEDLRAVARSGAAQPLDLGRARALAGYLAKLHTPLQDAARYRRAVRDLIGHGEGIFGVVDAFPDHVPSAEAPRLAELERACASWRWSLRGKEHRLCRTHGDFHPFNVVFDDGTHFKLLDASRGVCGDPADDVTAMAVNFLLFAIDTPNTWHGGLGSLWHAFWNEYLAARPDSGLLEHAPPFWTWRTLVVCNPVFYPELSPRGRHALLGLAERTLSARRLDPRWADELFA